MMRIDAAGRPGAARAGRPDRPAAGAEAPARGRALAVVPTGGAGGQGERRRRWRIPATHWLEAGFVVQLIVARDPGLRPARIERTRVAAALYARAAERLG